ncbi:hypothetical protein JCM30237_05850 [Halolamina litorea]|uniref:TIR domain-containing protein n=1 Tax=Halolamina litorea TaxID=1515593 RepID=A0ABD6BPK2_9EURY|nr:TIR domain-containing protein [Halolamina litorea]
MDLPDRPGDRWRDLRQDVIHNNSIKWVQQDEVSPLPPNLDAYTDVLPGVRVHHSSWANKDDIAVWEPGNTNLYLVTRYELVEKLLESKSEIPQRVIAVLILAGGAVVFKVLLDLLQGLADSSTSETTSKTGRQSQQRPNPRNRQYNIFISHAWDYTAEYERVVEFLDGFEELEWQNHSVPLADPLDVVNGAHLRSRLKDQIRTTSIVLVLAGMYSAHRKWIQNEIELAEEFDKPIVGIEPYGSEQTPNVVEDVADEMVGWRRNSIVRAIVDNAE